MITFVREYFKRIRNPLKRMIKVINSKNCCSFPVVSALFAFWSCVKTLAVTSLKDGPDWTSSGSHRLSYTENKVWFSSVRTDWIQAFHYSTIFMTLLASDSWSSFMAYSQRPLGFLPFFLILSEQSPIWPTGSMTVMWSILSICTADIMDWPYLFNLADVWISMAHSACIPCTGSQGVSPAESDIRTDSQFSVF